MTYMENNLAFAGGIQELSDIEVAIVGGGLSGEDFGIYEESKDGNTATNSGVSDLVGAVAGAIAEAYCNFKTKGTKPIQCATTAANNIPPPQSLTHNYGV